MCTFLVMTRANARRNNNRLLRLSLKDSRLIQCYGLLSLSLDLILVNYDAVRSSLLKQA